ncbi:MAG: cell division protein FtsZ [Alphaproteobacteria bacterium]
MTIPDIKELKPKITVFGVGGAGGNAVNNMIRSGLAGCEFVVANTDSQALTSSEAQRRIQMGVAVTEGLGAGSQPEIGRAAAEEVIDEITDHLTGAHMIFVTAGMGGGTGTGAAPVIARAAREAGILTVGVVTKPFQFEGGRRMRVAEAGIIDLQEHVDTLIVIPNQNLFRIANEKTTFADAFAMADQVLFSGVACITDLMVKEGLINLDFADVRSVMREMGKAMMGTGEASGDGRAQQAAEAAIANPLLDETSMMGAKGLLISITGGRDLTLFEVDEAATRIREEVDPDANVILGATFDESLEGVIRVSVVATGIEAEDELALPKAPVRTIEAAPRPKPIAAMPPSRASAEAARPVALEGRPVAPAIAQRPSQAPQAAAAAMAAAAAPAAETRHAAPSDPDVLIAPLSISTSDFGGTAELDADPQAPGDSDLPGAEPFIPPSAEVPSSRIPKVEDFPPIVQRQLSPRRSAEESQGPRSLLKRLANVSLGRRDQADDGLEEATQAAVRRAPPQAAEPGRTAHGPMSAPPARSQQTPAHRPLAPSSGRAEPPPQTANNGSTYQPRRGDLDAQGRTIPRDARLDEGELEIPAFLRRQAN